MVSAATFFVAVAAVASTVLAAPSPLISDGKGKIFGQYDLGFEGYKAMKTSGNCQFMDVKPSADPANPNFIETSMRTQTFNTSFGQLDALVTECHEMCAAKKCAGFNFVRKNGKNICQTGAFYACGSGYKLECSKDIIGTGYSNPDAPRHP